MAHQTALLDRIRVLLLLDALEAADMGPVPVMRLHAFALLADLLGPIWGVDSHDGKILKRQGGAYYPRLQRQLDMLVGLGFVEVTNVSYAFENGLSRLEGCFQIASGRAEEVIASVRMFSEEERAVSFLRRLAFSLQRVSLPIEKLIRVDATWADQRTGTGDVIDFSEWKSANYSAYSAQLFARLVDPDLKIGCGERTQLYVRLLEHRAHG
ncbi:hypothetical protein [Rhodocista pekingensis]|uniref:Uncharacterized protein n=1 Tax=Rhodocista pekingensis TaxID=201185 RepID=A0ABW2KYN8_9PROT